MTSRRPSRYRSLPARFLAAMAACIFAWACARPVGVGERAGEGAEPTLPPASSAAPRAESNSKSDSPTYYPSAARPEPEPELERPTARPLRGERSAPADPSAPKLERVVFRDTELQDALRILAEKGNLNLVFDAEILKGKRVTVELKNVTAEAAINAILRMHGLAALKSGTGSYRVGER